jgi:uncharacterized UBP type Zn finger protein
MKARTIKKFNSFHKSFIIQKKRHMTQNYLTTSQKLHIQIGKEKYSD